MHGCLAPQPWQRKNNQTQQKIERYPRPLSSSTHIDRIGREIDSDRYDHVRKEHNFLISWAREKEFSNSKLLSAKGGRESSSTLSFPSIYFFIFVIARMNFVNPQIALKVANSNRAFVKTIFSIIFLFAFSRRPIHAFLACLLQFWNTIWPRTHKMKKIIWQRQTSVRSSPNASNFRIISPPIQASVQTLQNIFFSYSFQEFSIVVYFSCFL